MKKRNTAGIRETLLLRLDAERASGVERLPFVAAGAGTAKPAREGSLSGDDWRRLEETVLSCTSCSLHQTRTRAVFGEGDADAELMFVGEAPGRDEDLSGKPFVGRAGQLLTRMIAAMGFGRDEVFIANVLKCRPPGNRTPTSEEIALCLPHLKKQIERIAPRVIVALGAPAAKTLLDTREGITSLRGRVFACAFDDAVRVVPTFHPAYLLRTESEKPRAWQDLKLALKVLAGDDP